MIPKVPERDGETATERGELALPGYAQQAIERFLAIGAGDPRRRDEAGVSEPHQIVEGRLFGHYVRRLVSEPSLALHLACYCQHLGRWLMPRTDFPEGREGYLRWRKAASKRSAEQVREILESTGCPNALVAAVVAIVAKEGRTLGSDTQHMEDALCLTFLRLDAPDFAAAHPLDEVMRVLQRTWRKMSPAARRLALAEPFLPDVQALLRKLPESDDAAIPGGARGQGVGL